MPVYGASIAYFFRFAKDPSAPWVFRFDTNNAEDWEYMGMETSAEFPVRMDGTQEDATLPIGTEIAITEISLSLIHISEPTRPY